MFSFVYWGPTTQRSFWSAVLRTRPRMWELQDMWQGRWKANCFTYPSEALFGTSREMVNRLWISKRRSSIVVSCPFLSYKARRWINLGWKKHPIAALNDRGEALCHAFLETWMLRCDFDPQSWYIQLLQVDPWHLVTRCCSFWPRMCSAC